ncbi:hypothetical protein JCM18899A_23550 [Nocardioides sp. AN3]
MGQISVAGVSAPGSAGDGGIMTADIEHYSKAASSQPDAELPGLILILSLLAVLAALVLAFS